MHESKFSELLDYGEATWLDWKRDFPAGLIGGRKHPEWHDSRAELLKDVVALANTDDGRPEAYLVFGVKDLGSRRELFGVSKRFDDADFQQWFQNSFEPPPRFAYEEVAIEEKTFAIFTIARVADYPHVAVQNVGDVLCKGQVWYRIGSKNEIATHKQLQVMFRGEEPFKLESTSGEVAQDVIRHYAERGEELVWPLIADKDGKLAQGYRIAYYPGTRREIWAGAFRGMQHMHIAMLKPKPGAA